MMLCFKMSPSIAMFTIFYIKGEYVLMIPRHCMYFPLGLEIICGSLFLSTREQR